MDIGIGTEIMVDENELLAIMFSYIVLMNEDGCEDNEIAAVIIAYKYLIQQLGIKPIHERK